MINTNLDSKSNKYSPNKQGISQKTIVNFLQKAYKSVLKGVNDSIIEFNKDPMQFNYRTAKAVWMNAKIKKLFTILFSEDNYLKSKIKHLKSHGVDYYLIEGKMLVCFKKMDVKSRVSGFYTKRFKDVLSGNSVHYSKTMLDNLATMGIHKPLPIYFVGHVLDKIGRLIDVRLIHYSDMRVQYELSLSNIFSPNLFNTINSEGTENIKENEIIVKPKKRKKLGNSDLN